MHISECYSRILTSQTVSTDDNIQGHTISSFNFKSVFLETISKFAAGITRGQINEST